MLILLCDAMSSTLDVMKTGGFGWMDGTDTFV
jgi:hypothetical protein